jgi:MurNAc alpha-1-phosphate uridylyltransferase
MTQASPLPASSPRTAMLLAAGLGTRMRPLTADTAKPLLALRGRTLLDLALDRLVEAGVERVVVNAHWQAGKVSEHLAGRAGGPEVVVRREESLLDTGGAVAAALAEGLLGDQPFYVVNGDAYWLDGPIPTLTRLAGSMAIEEADAVLLLQPVTQVNGEAGAGDFALDPVGVPRRPEEHEQVPYLFAGVQILAPGLFAGVPSGAFSMNRLWDAAIVAGRLRGIAHDGLWFHLSTPADLARAEVELRERFAGEKR